MRSFLFLLILVILVCVSIARNAAWFDDQTIWTDSLSKTRTKARGYNELGLYLSGTGKNEEALRVLRLSLALNPYQPEVYVNIGTVLEKFKLFDQAAESYRRAAEFNPTDPTAYYNLGALYYDVRHDREQALRYFLTARDLNPLEPDVHNYLSRIYRDRGDIARAEAEMARYRYLRHQ